MIDQTLSIGFIYEDSDSRELSQGHERTPEDDAGHSYNVEYNTLLAQSLINGMIASNVRQRSCFTGSFRVNC